MEGVKKDVKVIGDKQEQPEVREQLRDSKFESQVSELADLRERMAKLEANSGNSALHEIVSRKIREGNIVIHQNLRLAQHRREEREMNSRYRSFWMSWVSSFQSNMISSLAGDRASLVMIRQL